MHMKTRARKTMIVTIAGTLVLLLILVLSSVWMGMSARQNATHAVRSVSDLYLDELAGRREQVVASNLQNRIRDMQTALGLLTEEDLQDMEHLQAYQARIRQLYTLEKFAFVDDQGLIYTSQGTQENIDDYAFDYRTIRDAEISVLNLESREKQVIIAQPMDPVTFLDRKLVACFMELQMDEMLSGVSVKAQSGDTTFCNLYTNTGVPLSNTVLGGLAEETNLLEAMRQAVFETGYSYERFADAFTHSQGGQVSFSYNGIQETLSFVPVNGTDWLLTYLIRESVIADQMRSVSDEMLVQSILQSLLTMAVLLLMFGYTLTQNRKSIQLEIEKETSEAENRARQQELERRLELQEQLLEEEKHREQQERMITALSSDYWSVYYIELDRDEGVCYQAHSELRDGVRAGEHFPYLKTMTDYAEKYVTEAYRQEFLAFIHPEAIRRELAEHRVTSYTYLVSRDGRETYEMIRFAGVRHPEERDDQTVHTVGACFTDVDRQTREARRQQQTLSDALASAEEANRAKTAFLSSMSHEIRTPMNAIIGLDTIALNDPQTPETTRDYLKKIGTSAEHLLSLINDILDMSRIESGRMTLRSEAFSFRKLLEVVNTMFSGQCAEKGLEYHCNIDEHVEDSYIGDAMKLRQVLVNILGNAVKFTPAGGQVRLTVEETARIENHASLRFTIADTGIGMSPEFLPHVFDAFAQEDSSTTSRYGSSGLGMAITRNMVQLMNGEIGVESEKGRGTTFVVTVPMEIGERTETSATIQEILPEHMQVLVVDDDPVACEHARVVLGREGIAVDSALSGKEALEKVQLHHARRMPYTLILMDWKMPDMDGIETTRAIRSSIGDESAVILLTAYHWDDVSEEAIKAGVDSFLSKPVFTASVLDEYQAAMQRRAARKETEKPVCSLEGLHVLLAEDVEINAEIMLMILGTRGVQADVAGNGKIALDMFSASEEGHYAAVLMDMRMPEMDGLEATRRIRALDRTDARAVPIIALTANAFDEDVQRSLQAGLNAHLSKPVQPEVLFETLESLISARVDVQDAPKA